jgi:hypothetical protein
MSLTQLEVLANCAASFLLLLLFLLLSGLSVGLVLALRGLHTARAELPWRIQLLEEALRETVKTTQTAAHAAVDPQVRLISGLVGAKATARALFGRAPRPPVPAPHVEPPALDVE